MHSSSSQQLGDKPALIAAIAVLYKRTILESESVSSLLRILEERPEWRSCFSLTLYDNSPEPQQVPSNLPITPTYVHDAGNGGLAPAYEYALQRAAATGTNWLLLLDQDTTLTADYVAEVLRRIVELEDQTEIGSIVPKLVAKGRVYSPESDVLYQMRHQFQSLRHPVLPTDSGTQLRPMSAYNSGAVIRVAALQAIGGFPADFWLDYLDHAVFQLLHRRGLLIFVMEASLEQNLSHLDINDVPHWRHRSVLTAQTRFITRYGQRRDRFFFRVYLLRTSCFMFFTCRNRRVWKEMLLQMLLLRVPSVQLGS
jgi:GT2 family glycosyltransferase